MKRKLLLLLLVSMTGVSFASETVKYRDIELSEAGGLAEALGADLLSIDSLVLKGKVGVQDFETMWRASYEGRLAVIDMSGADVENQSVPDNAFVRLDSQELPGNKFVSINLRKICLPENIMEFGDNAFYRAENLESINFPKSLNKIGNGCFLSCMKLNFDSLVIPENVSEIGDRCFSNCRGIKKIILPDVINRIGDEAFASSGISQIDFPDNLSIIGEGAFSDTQFLEKAIIPDGCTFEGTRNFAESYVGKIKLPTDLTLIPESFAELCPMMTEINMPVSLKTVEPKAFKGCGRISKIEFYDEIEEIKESAFAGCHSLKEISFPSSIRSIEERAFANCSGLERIYSVSPLPPACDKGAFSGCSGDVTLYVPAGTSQSYKGSEGWNYFTNVIETDEFPKSSVREIRPQRSTTVVYDLKGRKIARPKRGDIYITGERKIIPSSRR